MRTPGSVLGLSIFLLAITACGGGVGDIGKDGGGGNSEAGDPGYEAGTVGTSSCPPSSQIEDGFPCSVAGASCPSGTPVYDCSGKPVVTPECVCNQTSWVCEQFVTGPCESPPSAGCPDPTTIFPQMSCDGTINQTCVSTNVPTYGCDGGLIPYMATCACKGNAWVCSGGGATPCSSPPPSMCPDPESIAAYAECAEEQLLCPGNPTDCDGQIFYDALRCTGGSWNPVATTTCQDGGAGGSVLDSPPIQDAPTIVDTF